MYRDYHVIKEGYSPTGAMRSRRDSDSEDDQPITPERLCWDHGEDVSWMVEMQRSRLFSLLSLPVCSGLVNQPKALVDSDASIRFNKVAK
jgi:hypothetical protein